MGNPFINGHNRRNPTNDAQPNDNTAMAGKPRRLAHDDLESIPIAILE